MVSSVKFGSCRLPLLSYTKPDPGTAVVFPVTGAAGDVSGTRGLETLFCVFVVFELIVTPEAAKLDAKVDGKVVVWDWPPPNFAAGVIVTLDEDLPAKI